MNTPSYNDVNVNGTTLDTSIMNERSSLKTAYMFSIGTLIALAIVLIPVGTSNIYPSVQYAEALPSCLSNPTSCTLYNLSTLCLTSTITCNTEENAIMADPEFAAKLTPENVKA